jgi:choline dehydrogenase-like flavoprotein
MGIERRMLSVETGLTDCTRHFTSDQGVLAAIAPFLGPTLTPSKVSAFVGFLHLFKYFLDTPFDWNYTVTPQEGMQNRSFPYPRGKLLGGSSSASEQTSLYHIPFTYPESTSLQIT